MNASMSRTILIILAGFFLISVMLLSSNSLSDPDTGFHLATGKYVVQNKTIPTHDPFSYTSNAPLIAHYWLSGVVFYGIESFGGGWGLIVLVALIAGLTYSLILLTLRVRKALTPLSFVVLIPFVYFTVELWKVRPQIFSYLFIVLTIYLLESWRIKGKTWPLYVLPVLFLLWANMHAGVVLGIAICGLYGLDLLRRLYARQTKEWIVPVFILVASGLITLVNPNGIQTLLYSSVIASSLEQMHILEWKSIIYYIFLLRSKIFLGLMILSLALMGWRTYSKLRIRSSSWRERIGSFDLVGFGMVAGAFVMPLVSIRHVGFFPLMAAPFVVCECVRWMKEKDIKLEKIRGAMVLIVLLGMASVVAGGQHVWNMMEWDVHNLPVGAADFIERTNPQGPIFNSMELGGYFIWRFWPQRHVFIDGRSELYAGTVNRDYIAMIRKEPGWQVLFDNQYGINTVVMRYRQWKSWAHEQILHDFIQELNQRDDFWLVYWDDAAVILVRDIPQHKELIEQYGLSLIAPAKDPVEFEEWQWEEIEKEFDQALGQVLKSYVLEGYATRFLLHKKEVEENN